MLRGAVLAIAVLLIGGLIVQGVEELAELHVAMLTLDPPSAITRGLDIEVHARLMNTGQRPAESFSVGFFYRPANGAGSWTLVATEDDATLAPSQDNTLDVVFTLPTLEMELGVYEIRVVADPLNQIPEVDEFNNELQTSFTLIASSIGLPDLQPASLSYTPTNPESTDELLPWNVTATIQNPAETASGAFSIVFYVNDVEFDRKFLFALPSGGSTEVIGELDPFLLELGAGTHEVSVAVDPDDQVLEQDEGNNTIAGSLTLLSPDLFPTALSFDKTVVRLDEEVRVTATVANDGKGTAKDVDVAFYVDHTRFGLVRIPLLGRGLSAEVEVILSPELLGLTDAPEAHEISIVIDPNNSLPELDEANNELIRTLTILPPGLRKPELHPESIELNPASPVELGRSDTVAVSTVIRNSGRADALGFNVTFSYRVKGGLRWETFPCTGDASCSGITLAAGMQTKLVGLLPVIMLPPGVYEFRVLVDAGASVDELDEANNSMLTSMTLLAARLPDLAMCPTSLIQIEPSTSVHRGQTIRITPCVGNYGDLDAGPFLVRFSYQNQFEAATAQVAEFRSAFFSPGPDMQVRELAIGETAEIPVLLETKDLSPGQYLVQIEIDPSLDNSLSGQVAERNERNNLFSTQISILGPDLAPLDLYTIPGDVIDQSTLNEIEVVSTILNSGVAPAGEFTVKFALLAVDELGIVPGRVYTCDGDTGCGEDGYFGQVTLPGIGTLVPEQVRCSIDLQGSDLEPGQYIVRVLVDCDGDLTPEGACAGKVAEHNELNNYFDLPIVISGVRATDLAVTDIAVAPDEDQSLIVTSTIENLGFEAASAFDAYLRLTYHPAECGGEKETCPDVVYTAPILVPGLGGFETFDVVWTLEPELLQALPGGEYTLEVSVDCDGEFDEGVCIGHIAESDETNNSLEQPFAVDGVAAPGSPTAGTDLSIQSFHAIQMAGSQSGTSQLWVTIVNQGEVDLGEFYVQFYYSANDGSIVDLTPRRVRLLLAGDTTTVLQQVDSSDLAEGYHTAGVRVDVDNDILETIETNNTREEELYIR